MDWLRIWLPCFSEEGLSKAVLKDLSRTTHWGAPELKQRYVYYRNYTKGEEMTKEEVQLNIHILAFSLSFDHNLILYQFCDYFKNQLRSMGTKQLTRLFRSADVSKNRSLSFREVVQLMYVVEKGTAEERLDVMWRMFDSEGAGYLLDTDEQFLVEHMRAVAEVLGQDQKSAAIFIEKVKCCIPDFKLQHPFAGFVRTFANQKGTQNH